MKINTDFAKFIIFFLEFILSTSQRTAHNETCNSTEECSDHRYQCQLDQDNVWRCLCDRFHVWDDVVGCVQIYNASEIMNMTLGASTDNIKFLEDQVEFIIKAQIGAGLFVFGMVIFAVVIVFVFCVYVHITDRQMAKTLPPKEKNSGKRRSVFRGTNKPSTSTTLV